MKRVLVFAVLMCVAVLFCTMSVLGDDEAVAAIDGSEIFVAEAGGEPCRFVHNGDSLRATVKPESTIYFSIDNASRAEDFTGLRAVLDWSKGEEMTSYPRIEYREMMDETGQVSLGYRYVIALGILDTADSKSHTLRGTIKLAKRANAQAPTVSFTLSVRSDGQDNIESTILCCSKSLIVKFENSVETATISFYNMGYFEVDVLGQSLLDVGCSLEPVTDIAERYPNAKLRFLSWRRKPFFDHEGKLVIEAQPGEFFYELRKSSLIDRTDSYSQEQEAFVLQIRRLEGFVISDRALSFDAVAVPQSNPPTAGGLR